MGQPDTPKLADHEAEELLAIYRTHHRPLGEQCSCGTERCRKGPDARYRLWRAGKSLETGR